VNLGKKTKNLILDIIFPPLCLSCRINLLGQEEKENLLCNACFNNIPIFKTIFRTSSHQLLSVSSYENIAIQKLIHYFKYEGFLSASSPIEKLVAEYLNNINAQKFISSETIIIPIPLHKSRIRKRGFNQAEIIANILGKQLNLQVKNKILKRIKNTEQQMSIKDNEKRIMNVKNCFILNQEAKEKIKDKPIILVDDVYTSGATINEAIGTLKKCELRETLIFVLAKTN
jgi:competence protein ComFC